MMYNHYIPGSNGVYKRHSIPIAEHSSDTPPCEQENGAKCQKSQQPIQVCSTSRPDIGDLLLLCITILLLIDADEADALTIMIAIAAFMFHL